MRVLRAADSPRVRWRNDGGWTRELVRSPDGAGDGFDWRVSVADVEADGPFSAFDGYDRLLVLLEGAGMDLHFTETGQTTHLRAGNRRARFRGESPIHATLVDGPTTDFNLIWRRDQFLGVAHLVGPADGVEVGGGDGVVAGLFVVSGSASGPGGETLAAGDGIVGAPGERPQVALAGTAVLFLVAPAAGLVRSARSGPSATGLSVGAAPERSTTVLEMATIASLRHHDATLEVAWTDGVVTQYPWLWLRDHAHDDDTMHPVTQQRQLFTARVPATLKGLSTEVVDGALQVTWDVLEPMSVLPVAFLATYRHPRSARVAVDVPITLWNASSLTTPTVAHDLVMHTDAGVVQWLTNTLQYGFCIVTGTPATAAATEALLRRVAYIRETIFGGFWEFQADMSKADTAYTTLELRGHTDGTYSNDAPGCQLLHCLEFVGSGGESTMVDAFAIARRMEAEHAELFEVLSSVTVPGQYIGDGAHLMAARPVFRHDHTGRLVQVSFNNYDRAPFLLEAADMIAFYDGLRVFEELANDPSMQWRHVLQPGEAMLFDNWRVLHGRAAYTGLRRMCGGYLNREDIESRLRSLR